MSRRTLGLRGSVDVGEAAAALRIPATRVHEAIGAGTLTAKSSGRLVLGDVVEYASDRRLIARSRKVEAAVRAGRQGWCARGGGASLAPARVTDRPA